MSDDRDLQDEGPLHVPLPSDIRLYDERTYIEVGKVTVGGETFVVRRSHPDGANHYDWVSGPNSGYGFTVSGSPEPLSDEQHRTAIRGFLAGIDPATGYL